VYCLDENTGEILWQYDTGGEVKCGLALTDCGSRLETSTSLDQRPQKFMSLGIDYYGVNRTVVRHLQSLHQARTQVKLFGDMKTQGLVLWNLW
jgi:outer membrane protein assembly factor BamB